MYMPIDPDRNVGAWDGLLNSMKSQALFCVVSKGALVDSNVTSKLPERELLSITDGMKQCSYVRLGDSSGLAFPPHFAVEVNGECANLMYLICRNKESSSWKTEIIKLIQMIFVQLSGLKTLNIPCEFNDIQESGFTVTVSNGLTKISRVEM